MSIDRFQAFSTAMTAISPMRPIVGTGPWGDIHFFAQVSANLASISCDALVVPHPINGGSTPPAIDPAKDAWVSAGVDEYRRATAADRSLSEWGRTYVTQGGARARELVHVVAVGTGGIDLKVYSKAHERDALTYAYRSVLTEASGRGAFRLVVPALTVSGDFTRKVAALSFLSAVYAFWNEHPASFPFEVVMVTDDAATIASLESAMRDGSYRKERLTDSRLMRRKDSLFPFKLLLSRLFTSTGWALTLDMANAGRITSGNNKKNGLMKAMRRVEVVAAKNPGLFGAWDIGSIRAAAMHKSGYDAYDGEVLASALRSLRSIFNAGLKNRDAAGRALAAIARENADATMERS